MAAVPPSGIDEPGVLIAGVVGDQVDKDLDTAPLAAATIVEIGQGAELGLTAQ